MRIGSILVKRPVKKLLRRAGIELLRRPNLAKLLNSRKIDVFLDVGANIGQTGQELREQGYRGRIVSFEPVKRVFEQLKRRADLDGNWVAHNFGLGSATTQLSINVSENTVFSSILDQTGEVGGQYQAARVMYQEVIEIRRLDDIFAEYRNHNVFLKIVTQGFEREVLEGATESLNGILGVELILPIVQLYQGNWSLPEALVFMSQKGFALAQTGQESYAGPDEATLLELYCIFRRDYTTSESAGGKVGTRTDSGWSCIAGRSSIRSTGSGTTSG
jgi:FkbM family methyltransferase